METKTILHIATENCRRMRRRYVVFNPGKHSVLAGNLVKSGKIIGRILRVTSE
jgi:hypothetical protein